MTPAELNFRSRSLKFRLRLQKPRSFGASELHIVIWGLILKVFKNAISFSLKQFKLRNCTNQKQHLPIRNFFAPRKDTLGEIIASLVHIELKIVQNLNKVFPLQLELCFTTKNT